MAADVQYQFTEDPDTSLVSTNHTWFVNGVAAGTVNQNQAQAASELVSYSDIPGAPALVAGDTVTVSTITTDSFGQNSPTIAAGQTVTIVAVPPPPLGITPGTLKQVGSP